MNATHPGLQQRTSHATHSDPTADCCGGASPAVDDCCTPRPRKPPSACGCNPQNPGPTEPKCQD